MEIKSFLSLPRFCLNSVERQYECGKNQIQIGVTQLKVFLRSWTAVAAVQLPLNCVSPVKVSAAQLVLKTRPWSMIYPRSTTAFVTRRCGQRARRARRRDLQHNSTGRRPRDEARTGNRISIDSSLARCHLLLASLHHSSFAIRAVSLYNWLHDSSRI